MRKPLSLAMRCVKDAPKGCFTCDEPGAQQAHYEAFVMDLPKGWIVKHFNKSAFAATCVNPDHLIPVDPTPTAPVLDGSDWYYPVRDCGIARSSLAYRMRTHHLTLEEAIAWVPPPRVSRSRKIRENPDKAYRPRRKSGVVGREGPGAAPKTFDFLFLRDGVYKTPRELALRHDLPVATVYDRLASGDSFERAIRPPKAGGRPKSKRP